MLTWRLDTNGVTTCPRGNQKFPNNEYWILICIEYWKKNKKCNVVWNIERSRDGARTRWQITGMYEMEKYEDDVESRMETETRNCKSDTY